jgi:hypothetical protein
MFQPSKLTQPETGVTCSVLFEETVIMEKQFGVEWIFKCHPSCCRRSYCYTSRDPRASLALSLASLAATAPLKAGILI